MLVRMMARAMRSDVGLDRTGLYGVGSGNGPASLGDGSPEGARLRDGDARPVARNELFGRSAVHLLSCVARPHWHEQDAARKADQKKFCELMHGSPRIP